MKIIDNNKKLRKAGIGDWLKLQGNRDRLVKKPVERLSRKHGDVIYGRHAVNKLLGPGYHRDTYDYDVYSKNPRSHAVMVENRIDRGTKSNLAYVEPARIDMYGKTKTVYRVKVRPYDTGEVDFNRMPSDVRYVKKNGVRYETIGKAHKKYSKMIDTGQTHRMPKAFWDKADIDNHRFFKKRRI